MTREEAAKILEKQFDKYQNKDKSDYEKDLTLVREILENTKYLKKKYPRFTLEEIPDVISIVSESEIKVDELRYYQYAYELTPVRGGFSIYISHGYNLGCPTTKYKFDETKWYARFSCNGCGRLNIINDSKIAYQGEPDAVWKEFINKIKSYSPLDYDDMNSEYIFTLQDGYRLFKDFPNLLEEVRTKMQSAVKAYKIQQLQSEIDRLKGGCNQ